MSTPAWLALLPAVALAGPFEGEPASCDDVYPAGDELEVFLVTMAPGGAAFSFVGHTALWVRIPDRFDGVFNFGTFDSDGPNPAVGLMMGTLQCFWTIRSREKEIRRYQRQERSMVAQRIELPERTLRRLVHEVRSGIELQVDVRAPMFSQLALA